jgi:hypothetical protein
VLHHKIPDEKERETEEILRGLNTENEKETLPSANDYS